jgi:hypothetical protein
MRYLFSRRRSDAKTRRQTRTRYAGRRLGCEPLEQRLAMTLALTEIMYHPADATAPDDFEFIELKNISAQSVQLGGMQLIEDTTPGTGFGISYTFAAQSLAPGAYVVVAKNVAAFQNLYGTGINVVGPFGGTLGNGGERLVVRDAAAATVFDFAYDDGWKPTTDGDGKSLVLLNDSTPESQYDQAGSWDASISFNGSPGRDETGVLINEVLSHTDESLGDWIELTNTSTQPIDIGGWYLSDDAAQPQKFRIPAGTVVPAGGFVTFTQDAQFDNPSHPGALVPFGLSEFGEEVVLSQAGVTGALGAYRVVQTFGASNREVTFGRFMMSTGEAAFPALQSATFNAANAAPRVDAVAINELMYEPLTGGDEFVEIRNLFQIPVQLFDPLNPANVWKFDSGITFDFPQGTILPPGGYALVTQLDPAAFRTKYNIPASVQIFGPYTGSLNNSGEEVTLSRPGDPELDGTVPYYVVDIVDYLDGSPWPTGTGGTGATLARRNPLGYGEDPINWAAGPVGGTPGAANTTGLTAPTNVAAAAMATNRIRVTWTDSVSGEASFRIERSIDGVNFTPHGLVGAGVTSFDDVGLKSSMQYTYRVRAFAGVDGPASNSSSATTPQLVAITGASGADTYHVRRAGTLLQVFENTTPLGQPTYSSELAAMNGTLTINAGDGNDALTVNAGGQASLGLTQLNYSAGSGANILVLEQGSARIDSTATGGTLNTTVQASAQLTTNRLNQNGLTISGNGRVNILPGGQTNLLTTLDVSATGTLDFANNDLVIQSTAGAKPALVSALSTRLASGYAGGLWNGAGVNSSTAAANTNVDTGLNLVDNALLVLLDFGGTPVNENSILLKYTYYGDIDLNGQVDADDLTVFANNFGRTSGATQIDGDIDFDGDVDADDLTVFANNFGKGVGAPLAAGPVSGAVVSGEWSGATAGLSSSAAVVARSPDHATFSTEGLLLPDSATTETSGPTVVRGQETRAQRAAGAVNDDLIVDFLTRTIAADAITASSNTLADARLSTRHTGECDELWASW